MGNSPLQLTELINEAYLRIADLRAVRAKDRLGFYTLAGAAMRSALIDEIRRQDALKNGGGQALVGLHHDPASPASEDSIQLLRVALNDGLDALRVQSRDSWQVFMLVYFAGLTHQSVASLQGSTKSAVGREWRFARAFLLSQLSTD